MRTQTSQLISVSTRRVMRLLLALSCSMLFAALTQARSYDFLVPGQSGPAWVDTGIYLPQNTWVEFSATGEVDVSAGWGRHGPSGTPRTPSTPGTPPGCARLPGYPVPESDNCYGLAAQLTQDRTRDRPFRVLAQWTYGETNRYLAAPQGGHLWLTVNDDNPGDNTGAFKVHVEITTFPIVEIYCHPCPFDKIDRKRVLGQPIPDPKTMQALLLFDGEITAINQSDGMTLVSVSQGTVLAKYGDLPNLRVVFAKGAAGLEASLSKQGVVQGVVFKNEKMSLMTGASRLKLSSAANLPESKPNSKQTIPD